MGMQGVDGASKYMDINSVCSKIPEHLHQWSYGTAVLVRTSCYAVFQTLKSQCIIIQLGQYGLQSVPGPHFFPHSVDTLAFFKVFLFPVIMGGGAFMLSLSPRSVCS